MTDYKAMNCGQLYDFLKRSDASVWVEAFNQFHPDNTIEDGIMLSWFANAYMAGFDRANDLAVGETVPLCGDHAEWLQANGEQTR